MREVVGTILSKRWKDLWTTIPYLNFDDPKMYSAGDRAPQFVNRALILRRGFKILKFNFGFHCYLNKSLFSDTDLWMRLAKENGVEELYLDYITRNSVDSKELYRVPHNLYSCSSLKVLSLKGCNLQIHGNVHWNQLRSLTIEGYYFLDELLINQVISGSPQLEVFILNLWDSDKNLSIRSSSLEKLSIEKCLRSWNDEPSTVAELRIWSPNLETLEILGVPL